VLGFFHDHQGKGLLRAALPGIIEKGAQIGAGRHNPRHILRDREIRVEPRVVRPGVARQFQRFGQALDDAAKIKRGADDPRREFVLVVRHEAHARIGVIDDEFDHAIEQLPLTLVERYGIAPSRAKQPGEYCLERIGGHGRQSLLRLRRNAPQCGNCRRWARRFTDKNQMAAAAAVPPCAGDATAE